MWIDTILVICFQFAKSGSFCASCGCGIILGYGKLVFNIRSDNLIVNNLRCRDQTKFWSINCSVRIANNPLVSHRGYNRPRNLFVILMRTIRPACGRKGWRETRVRYTDQLLARLYWRTVADNTRYTKPMELINILCSIYTLKSYHFSIKSCKKLVVI